MEDAAWRPGSEKEREMAVCQMLSPYTLEQILILIIRVCASAQVLVASRKSMIPRSLLIGA